MGQAAVSALTGRGDSGHRGKFVDKRRTGAAFEPNTMVSVPSETKDRRAGRPPLHKAYRDEARGRRGRPKPTDRTRS
jgi:hypothetical protein